MPSADAIATRLAHASGLEVVVASASLDTAVEQLQSERRRIVLAFAPSAPLAAALQAAVRASPQATVLAGTREELAVAATTMVHAIGPGRFVWAREWLLDPDATRFGRHGAALASPLDAERPRTLAESPLPFSEHVRERLVEAAKTLDLRRYPPRTPERLEQAIARREHVDPSWVVASAGGSLELLGRCLRAFADRGDEVLAQPPTYEQLAHLCALEGLVLRYAADLRAVSPRTRLVYAASPNNPDSRLLRADDLDAVRTALPPDRVVIVDEAYLGFGASETLFTAEEDDRAPVVVLRSLSKLDGLAGLRVGYALAPPPIALLLRRFALPYQMTALVEEAAVAALEDEAHRQATRQLVARARPRLVEGLRQLGFRVEEGGTHLVLAWPPKEREALLLKAIETHALPIEECAQVEDAWQLSVPEEAEVERILAVLGSVT